jgi:hypothetical protein
MIISQHHLELRQRTSSVQPFPHQLDSICVHKRGIELGDNQEQRD